MKNDNKTKNRELYLSDIIPIFRNIEKSLDSSNLIYIYGDYGTGKTGFIKNELKKKENINIRWVNSYTNKEEIYSYLRTKEFLYDLRVLVYDDIKIKNKVLYDAQEIINNNNVFIVIVNKKNRSIPNKYNIHKTRYPKKDEVEYYMNKLQIVDVDLRNKILKLEPRSFRRIEYTIKDGFYSGLKNKESKKSLTDNPFILSLGIAENINRLRRLDKKICKADMLKFINDYFYLDFIKLYYPNIQRMRLRFPNRLLKIKKK